MKDYEAVARDWLGPILFDIDDKEEADDLVDSLAALIAREVEAEREACAAIAETVTEPRPLAPAIARAIRARGKV